MSKHLLSSEWITTLETFNTLYLGYSGGLDSTVLLHALAQEPRLRARLKAVHINHGISANAPLWQAHCEQFCLDLSIECIASAVKIDCSANIEERARDARFQVFSSLIQPKDALVLAHHQDDQAETLLLQLVRGAGIDGLAAMPDTAVFSKGKVLRPLLAHTRQTLEHYAREHQLSFVEDESNADSKYSRNYLRHQVMPLLKEKWPGVVGNLAQTATHCRQAKTNLETLAQIDHQHQPFEKTLSIQVLKNLSPERRTNLLIVWLKKNQVQLPSTKTFKRIYEEVILAKEDAIPLVSLGQFQIKRYQDRLYIEKEESIEKQLVIEWPQFPNPLNNPALSFQLVATKVHEGLKILPGAKVDVRFRQGSERLVWHGQTKSLKKLMQEWKIEPWLRPKWPLIYIDNQLAAVVGFAVSDLFFAKENAWSIASIQAD